MPQPLRGADIVMRTLERAGHNTIFTLSGNHIMSLFDAAIGTSIDLVHTRHRRPPCPFTRFNEHERNYGPRHAVHPRSSPHRPRHAVSVGRRRARL